MSLFVAIVTLSHFPVLHTNKSIERSLIWNPSAAMYGRVLPSRVGCNEK